MYPDLYIRMVLTPNTGLWKRSHIEWIDLLKQSGKGNSIFLSCMTGCDRSVYECIQIFSMRCLPCASSNWKEELSGALIERHMISEDSESFAQDFLANVPN